MRLHLPKRLLAASAALVLLAGLLAACAPVATLNALVPAGSYTLVEGVAYGTDTRQRLDVYRPTVAAPADGFPVVVFLYGGVWKDGERADYKFVGEALASRGVLTLVADYRLYPQVRYPEFLSDSALAVAHGLRQASSLGGNPKRVFVMGHSAGGYNAAMVALDNRWLAAAGHSPRELAGWIGLAGPYDFYPITNPDARPVFFHPDYPAHSQPFDFITASAPPAFLGAARKDSLVDPQRNTQAMATRLGAAGVPVTLCFYDRVNHVTLAGSMAAPLRWLAPVLDDVVGFLTNERGAKR